MTTNILTNVVLTAYCACSQVCTKGTGITANGNKPVQGITVAASRTIPFGTTVIIPNVGTRIVQDRLAKRYDSRFDIYFAKHSDAKKFGIKTNQTIKIITLK